jgi:hypothetical protein
LFSEHRKSFISNKLYVIYSTGLILFAITLMTINYFSQIAEKYSLVYLVSI